MRAGFERVIVCSRGVYWFDKVIVCCRGVHRGSWQSKECPCLFQNVQRASENEVMTEWFVGRLCSGRKVSGNGYGSIFNNQSGEREREQCGDHQGSSTVGK